MKEVNAKVCLTSSAGGHMNELNLAIEGFSFREQYWLTYKSPHLELFLADKKHHFVMNTSSTNIITWIINTLQSFRILYLEKPDLIISTGAGVSFPTIFLGKLFFKCKVIFIVSAADVTMASRTPLKAYRYSDLFLVQWPELQKLFPNSKHIGVL
jgi:UDP-N-acetylglucosamine:LPS N-acetylglucosamine transferase